MITAAFRRLLFPFLREMLYNGINREDKHNMGKRILIVGGVAGGASVAARIRRLDEAAEITVFEKGPHVSFSNCCLPYFLSRIVPESKRLIMMTPEAFRTRYNIDVRTESEVTEINREKKTVTIANEGKTYEEAYDVLVLSPGAEPVMPKSIKGIDRDNVFGIRNVVDIVKLDTYLKENDIKETAVIGGGFIGCEIAENLCEAGLKVHLIEAADQIMAPLDFDLVQILHKEMLDHGIDLRLHTALTEIGDGFVRLADGTEIPAGAVVMAIGVRPLAVLAKKAGLDLGERGGIKVNAFYQTSDPSIYAVGDAVEVYNRLSGKYTLISLAGPAQMEARAAADHICGLATRNRGFIGSSVIRLFDTYAASTGLNEKTAEACGIHYDTAYVIPSDKVGLMPGSRPIHMKLLFEVPTGRILGAQAVGGEAADRRVDVVSAIIHMDGDLEDLRDVELCYAPVVGTAKDAVNMAAMVGLNVLHGYVKQVPMRRIRELVESGAYIVDVREPGEFAAGHLKTAVNIPLSQLRTRLDEIPTDRPVYLHCRTSQRSYNAARYLMQHGVDAWNIAGSYLGFSYYEYAQDVLEHRDPIMTEYNFK